MAKFASGILERFRLVSGEIGWAAAHTCEPQDHGQNARCRGSVMDPRWQVEGCVAVYARLQSTKSLRGFVKPKLADGSSPTSPCPKT